MKKVILLQGTIQLTKPPQGAQGIPIYAYIIPALVAPLLIFALGVALYFVSSILDYISSSYFLFLLVWILPTQEAS